MTIFETVKRDMERMREDRRYLHEHPEAAPAEQVNTMRYISARLDALDIPYEYVPGGGIFGFIECGKPGKTLLLRADMDALLIGESPENLAGPKACLSRIEGVSHACGHDAHTAMLLEEARLLKAAAPQLCGRIVLMFEQSEEKNAGILPMCRYIVSSGLHIDGAYATHVRWDISTGKLGVCRDTAMTGLYQFAVEIRGVSGHGSRPDLAKNTIDCLHMIYSALELQRVTLTRPDTCLTWAFCHVEAGTTHNIIPDRLFAEGTIRFSDTVSGAQLWARFKQIAAMMGELTGCTVKLSHSGYLLPTHADEACMRLFRDTADAELGEGTVVPVDMWMASESFSYITSMYPSAFCFVGIADPEVGSGANHHTPEFDVDERALPIGAAAAVAYAQAYLAAPPSMEGFTPLFADMEELIERVTEQ